MRRINDVSSPVAVPGRPPREAIDEGGGRAKQTAKPRREFDRLSLGRR